MIYQGKARHPVREVVLHCAAVSTGYFKGYTPFAVFSAVNRWHHERGFKNGFGYHGLFMPDGTFYGGRPFYMIGAHCVDHNRGTVGFLLVESRKIEAVGEFADYFTEAQAQSLLCKISDLPGITRVSGHNDYANRLCPGFKVQSRDWLPVPQAA